MLRMSNSRKQKLGCSRFNNRVPCIHSPLVYYAPKRLKLWINVLSILQFKFQTSQSYQVTKLVAINLIDIPFIRNVLSDKLPSNAGFEAQFDRISAKVVSCPVTLCL